MKKLLLLIVAFVCYQTSIAQCNKVINLKLTYLTNSNSFAKAVFSWQAPLSGNTPVGYQWQARTSGLPLSGATGLIKSGNDTALSAKFVVGTGLSYTFYVRSSCGGGIYSAWDSLKVTQCAFDPPYLIDFSNGLHPCSQVRLSQYDIANVNWSTSQSGGNGTLGFCTRLNPSDATYLTEPVNLKKDSTYTISFDWNGNSLDDDYYASFFGKLQTWGSGTRQTEYKPTTNELQTISFRVETYVDSRAGCFSVDNISISKTACGRPQNIKLENIKTNGVTIRWQPPSVGTITKYKVKIFNANTGANVFSRNGLADTFVIVTGLLPSKYYRIELSTTCSQEQSIVNEALFTTLCTAINLPYIEDFESSTVPASPGCTTVENIGNPNGWATDAPFSLPGFSGKVLKYAGSNNGNSWFFTRGLQLQAGKTYRLAFKYGNNSVFGTDKMEVKIGNNAFANAMTNTLVFLPSISAITPEVIVSTFTPAATGAYYIGFHAYAVGSSSGLIYLDDISVSKGNLIDATLFIDNNGNNIKEADEPLFTDANIITSKRSDNIITHSSTGRTFIEIDTGNYVTIVKPDRPYYTVSPATHQTSFSTNINIDTVYFGLKPIPNKRDLSISLITLGIARPGFPLSYQLTCKNKGTDSVKNFSLKFFNNAKLNFISATFSQTAIVGDTLIWNITQLNPDQSINIILSFSILPPPVVNNGDNLIVNANVSSPVTDNYPVDNNAVDFQIVRGSFDPNDKKESHGGKIQISDVNNGEYLQYTIRFQNTGTDTAFNVYIRDTLSSLLDWSTLEMLSASENYKLTVRNGNQLLWGFDNINLPDSNTNEAASHGYVTFRIKPAATVSVGSIITNNAFIYFDFNLPVETNLETTQVVSNVVPLRLLAFSAKADGEKNMLTWATVDEVNIHHFDIERSADGKEFTFITSQKAGTEKYAYADIKPLDGNNYYRLKIVENDGFFTYSTIRLVKDNSSLVATLFPNPAKNRIQVRLNNQKEQKEVQAQVISVDGKVVSSNFWTIPQGESVQSLHVAQLQKGNYLLKITGANKEQALLKFEKL